MKRVISLVWMLLAACATVATSVHAQDLPPELTGDYTNLPPPQPAPPARPTPAPKPTPTPAPAPSRTPAPAPVDEAPPEFDPEAGDVGPLPSEFGEDSVVEDTAPLEDSELPPADEDTFESASSQRPAQFTLGVGFGAGTLSFTRPGAGGVQKLPTTPYALADLDLRARLWPWASLSFELLARYQTSLGWALELDPLFALPENVPTRTQRIEFSAAPVLRVGETLSLAFPLGVALRLFTLETHQYPLDPYSLGSAFVRAEAIVKVTDSVDLRVGPEAHWILLFNRSLTREGVCCSGGALGAQALLTARLGRVFSLALAYRELRSLVPVAARFSDIERTVTARVLGEL